MLRPLFVFLACCVIHSTSFAGQSLEIPNVEAAQRALQERYMRFYEVADGLGYDLGDAPPHLTFPSREYDGRNPGLFPEDCFYETDIFDEESGRANTEVIYYLIGDLINQPLPDWDFWVHPSWHFNIEDNDATGGRMGVLGPIPYPESMMTPQNYLLFFSVFTTRLEAMSVLQFQVSTTDLSGDPEGAPTTRNLGFASEESCFAAMDEALEDFFSNTSFPLEQSGTIYNLERTQGIERYREEVDGELDERFHAYLHGTEGRFVIDYTEFPGLATVYGRLYDAALINLGHSSTADLAEGMAPHDQYNRWFRLDTFAGSQAGPYLSAPFAEHAHEAFLVPCPSGDGPAGGEYFGWGIAARVVVSLDLEHYPSRTLVACRESCLGCQGVAGLCSELRFGSIDFRMGLGKAADGDVGFLQLQEETIDPLSASPFGLKMHLAGEGAAVLRDGSYDNVLRQIVTDQILVDVEIIEPYRKYVVRQYTRNDAGEPIDRFFDPDPEMAFKVVTIENPQEPQFKAEANTDIDVNSYFFFAPNHGIPAGMLFHAFVDSTGAHMPEFWVNGLLRRDETYALYAFDDHHLTLMWWDSVNGWWDFDPMVAADDSETLTIQTPQPFGTLKITETRGGRSRIMEYSSSTASPAVDGIFTLADFMDNKERHHTRTRVFEDNGNAFTETTVKSDAGGNPIEVVERHYRVFPWNNLNRPALRDRAELVREVRDPYGSQQTTLYQYYEDPVADGQNYGLLKSEEHADGSWVAYDYDADGRAQKVYRPYLDSELSLGASGNRMEEIVRHPVVDLEGTGVDGIVVVRAESIDGEEVARRYQLLWSEPVDGYVREATIEAVAEGAPREAEYNLRSDRWSFAEGEFSGNLAKVKHADGSMSVYSYAIDAVTGERTTTVRRGVPDEGKNDVIDGSETITVVNSKGGRVSRVVSDIATGIVLDSAISLPEDFDELGRPLVTLFHDGTFEARDYEDCCGTVTITDRSGLVHVEHTEMDGTLTAVDANGIRSRYQDGYSSSEVTGFTRSVIREGRGTAEPITERIETFDPSGRMIASLDPRDGVDRLTRFNEALNGFGQLELTRRLPNGVDHVDLFHRDGLPRSQRVNGLDIVRYEYGVENDTHEIFDGDQYVSHSFSATTIKEIRVGVTGEETEWEKRYLDRLGRVYKVETPDALGNAVGNYHQTFYDMRGNRRKTIDPDGVTTLFEYNSRGELEFTVLDIEGQGAIDPSGKQRITRISRDVVNDPERGEIVRQRMAVWENDYQESETVVTVRDTSTDGLQTWETVYGELIGHTETLYEGNGRIVRKVTSADGTVGTYSEVNGFLESETVTHPDAGMLQSLSHLPDEFDRPSTTTDNLLGATTVFQYYNNGRLRSITTPNSVSGMDDSQTTEFFYDVMDRLVTTRLPNQATVEKRYYAEGPLKLTFGHSTNPVEYNYDRQGRVRTMTTWRDFDPQTEEGVPGEGAATKWTYNAQGLLESKTDPVGQEVSYTYTAGGRVRTRDWARLGVDETNPVRTVYVYGQGGPEDESVVSGDLRGIYYQNDPANTPAVRYTYHRSGRVATVEDASGMRELWYQSGLLDRETYTAGSADLLAGISIGREYDLRRLQAVEMESSAGLQYRADYRYNNSPHLKSAEFLGHQVSYTYKPDAVERQVLTYHNGNRNVLTVARHLDNLDRLTNQESSVNEGATYSFNYRYTSLNQRERVIREDGDHWVFGYDGLGQVVSGDKKRSDGDPVPGYGYGYTFDQIGNRIEGRVNDRPAVYSPNILNQYETREVPRAIDVLGLAHPEAGVAVNGQNAARDGDLFHGVLEPGSQGETDNPWWLEYAVTGTLTGGGHNDADRIAKESGKAYLPSNPESFQHDADGNLLRDGRWSYTWDAENRLIQMDTIAEAVAAGAPNLRLEFAYDSQHRRIRKTVEEFDAGWTAIDDRLFVYDGWNLIAELEAATFDVERSYLWGLDLSDTFQGAGGVGGLLMIATDDEVHYPVYDGNGNIMILLNAATGNESAQYEYGPFGEPIRATGPMSEENPFRFSTKYTDNETGLLYYGYRYLNPDTGRWLNRDPIEEFGGLNLYGFLGNDGVSQIDYLGLLPSGLEVIDLLLTTIDDCSTYYPIVVPQLEKILDDFIQSDRQLRNAIRVFGQSASRIKNVIDSGDKGAGAAIFLGDVFGDDKLITSFGRDGSVSALLLDIGGDVAGSAKEPIEFGGQFIGRISRFSNVVDGSIQSNRVAINVIVGSATVLGEFGGNFSGPAGKYYANALRGIDRALENTGRRLASVELEKLQVLCFCPSGTPDYLGNKTDFQHHFRILRNQLGL